MASPRVVVIGGGIIGLSSAVRVQQRLFQQYGSTLPVTLVADRFGVATTSHGAAGLWEPYYVSNTPVQDLVRWGSETYEHLVGLYHSAQAAATGTSCIVGMGQHHLINASRFCDTI